MSVLPRFIGDFDRDMSPLARRCATLEHLLAEERKRHARKDEDLNFAIAAVSDLRARNAWLEERLAEYARWGRPC